MRAALLSLCVALVGCGASQQTGPTAVDPAALQGAIDEVNALATQHCEDGVHGSLDHVATDGPLLIVGTAGEIIEGRPTLDQVNASYIERNIVVEHNCEGLQRYSYASAMGNVVWVEEALRTHAAWPGFEVEFPSQRTMIFERTDQGWRLRYYSLSVRLPDDQLDEAYAQPAEGAAQPDAPAEQPAAPAEGSAPPPAETSPASTDG